MTSEFDWENEEFEQNDIPEPEDSDMSSVEDDLNDFDLEQLLDQDEDDDEGDPILVLKKTLGGSSTGLSQPNPELDALDFQQEQDEIEASFQDMIQSINQNIENSMSDDSLSTEEKIELLKEEKSKIEELKPQWEYDQSSVYEDMNHVKRRSDSEDVLDFSDEFPSEEHESIKEIDELDDKLFFSDDTEYDSSDESPDDKEDVSEDELDKEDFDFEGDSGSDTQEISEWLSDVNPNYDVFDIDSPYSNNCGSCALAVKEHLNGNHDAVASENNIGTIEEMNSLTQMEQVSMSPKEIEKNLLDAGDGAHAIIGIDRVEGPGHWFNAANINGKVYAIDGQTGEIMDWPPDYGDVTNWDMSI